MNELIIDNFAGGGGASTGIEMAFGRPVDIAINHDPQAIAMYKVNHPYTKVLCESVWDVDPVEVTEGNPVALCWLSPDCFPVGTLILTNKGYQAIEEIKVGDTVLTHKQRWRAVIETSTAQKQIVEIRGHGHHGLQCSMEHPFFVKSRTNVWKNDIRQYRAVYSSPEWAPASMLQKDWYWSSPTIIPKLEIPDMLSNAKERKLSIDSRLMWLAGRYVGDGWTRLTERRAELVIICGKHESGELKSRIDMWPRTGRRVVDGELSWNSRELRTAVQYYTNSRALVKWLRENFGHSAKMKRIPAWLYGANKEIKEAFLDGYLSADGWKGKCRFGKEMIELNTVSKMLAYGLKQLAMTMGFSVSVHINNSPNKIIEGRAVKSNKIYKVKWRKELTKGHAQTFVEDGLLWSPIRDKEVKGINTVYNIGVEEDESYIAEGIVVHNCKHFSKAKGGKPVEKKIRGLAWVAVRWAKTVNPRVIAMENVQEFMTWGPLLIDGTPNKEKKGQTFRKFINTLRKYGYEVDYRILRASDYGTPTSRERLFLIARSDGKKIIWPEASHGHPDDMFVNAGILKPWRTAAEIIDWNIPCKSIFERKRPLAENTLKRIAKGIQKFIINNPDPFIIKVNHQGVSFRGQEIDKPMQTITSKNGWGLVTPFIARIGQTGFGTDKMQYPINKPLTTVTSKAEHLLVVSTIIQYHGEKAESEVRGQDVKKPIMTVDAAPRYGLIASFIARQFGNSIGNKVNQPLGSITAGGGGKSQIITSHIVKLKGTNIGQKVTEPLQTVTAGGLHFGEVRVFLIKYFGTAIGQKIDKPLDIITAKDRFGLITVKGDKYIIYDICMRMFEPHELFAAQGFPDTYIIDHDIDGNRFSKAVQVAKCGNAVPPQFAEAIVRVNLIEGQPDFYMAAGR
jgi:DNA (cytosine-5)-methyltransferase 1